MTSLLFLFSSLALFGISYPLIKRGTALTRLGGDAYLMKRRLKVLGYTLLATAGLLFVLAAVTQYYSGELPPNSPSPDDSANPSPVTTRGDLPLTTLPKPKPEQTDESTTNNTSDLPRLLPDSDAVAQTIVTHNAQIDAELAKIDSIIRDNPYNAQAYAERGNIYATAKDWFKAEDDYQRSLQIDGTNDTVKYNLADMSFAQKKYASARSVFSTVNSDSELADLASYKIFLCDLFGGQEDVAAKELARFNYIGSNASYYFANVAWSLYHKKPEEARSWIASADRIYAPDKLNLYGGCLFDLGYLPIPLPPQP